MKTATVESFLALLTSKLTQYDNRCISREIKTGGMWNHYRLSIFIGAQEKVKEDCKDILNKEDKESLNKLKEAMGKRFEVGFSPVNNVNKQIDKWINEGKYPNICK
jgi:hypothetical protein